LKPIFDEGQSETDTPIDFEIRYCNKVASEVLKTPKEMIIGQHLKEGDLLDEESLNLIYTQSVSVWKKGGQQEYTYYSKKLGKYFNVLRSKVLDGVINVSRDYTKEVLAEQKLKQQAELLNGILEASINGVFALEAIRDEHDKIVDLRFLKYNKMFLKLSGRTEAELEGKTYLQAFPMAIETFRLNCDVIETGEPKRSEVFYKDHQIEAWYDISLVKLGENGVVITFTDITEAKKDKEALKNSAGNLQNAIDSSQTGITVIYPEYENNEIIDFRYKVVNHTFSQYIGRQPGEMIGQLLSDMFPSYKAQGTFNRYKQIYNTGEPQRFDLHYVKDGYDVWVDIMAKKLGDEILVTFHDYTPLKKAQLQLETMVKDLKRSNTSLEDFAYAASHDLQEPLRKIHFFSDKLKSRYHDKLDEEGLNLFERMQAAAQRMRQLIDDLLVYSQINLKPKDDEKIDLNDVLHDVITDLEAIIQEKNARITTDLMPVIQGDKPQLRQLFLNLLSNSLKYVHKDKIPFVSITSRKISGRESGFQLPVAASGKDYYLVEVTDNGIGFDQSEADNIFNIFHRLHARAEYSGTGVGLAIVKKVIDNHQGYIFAHSEEGKGAKLSVI
jgi:signal transduction histidine kinase